MGKVRLGCRRGMKCSTASRGAQISSAAVGSRFHPTAVLLAAVNGRWHVAVACDVSERWSAVSPRSVSPSAHRGSRKWTWGSWGC